MFNLLLELSTKRWAVSSVTKKIGVLSSFSIRGHYISPPSDLIPSRFATDKQTSQLSRWLRPRLKKLNFFPAMQNFREFCSAALLNPALQPVPPPCQSPLNPN